MSRTAMDFQQQISALRQGEHLCSVYGDSDEMLAQVTPYLKAGLANGERCFYVADDFDGATIQSALGRSGVDVPAAVERGDLVFWTRTNYRQPGDFDLDIMYEFIAGTLSKALAERYRGIRLSVEMTWTLGSEVSERDLVRWEDMINTISYPGSQVSFICQYNSKRLPSELIRRAIHVHPVVVLGQAVCPNVQYMPSAVVLEEMATGDRLSWLLENLKKGRTSLESAETVRMQLEQLIKDRTTELAASNDALRAEIAGRARVEKALERSREQLQEKLKDLEAFHDLAVGRELKMIEMEREIRELRAALTKHPAAQAV